MTNEGTLRDRVLIVLLLHTGLRAREICQLRRDQIVVVPFHPVAHRVILEPLAPIEKVAIIGTGRSFYFDVFLDVCLIIYAIPRTSFFGAVLLTGYLSGAVVLQVRVAAPLFNMIFPLILGVLLWGGLFLRDTRLRALFSLKSSW